MDIINCHANTETSDLLGGLRPLRGRKTILSDMTVHVKSLIQLCSGFVNQADIPSFLIPIIDDGEDVDMIGNEMSLPSDASNIMLSFALSLWNKYKAHDKHRCYEGESSSKRRKLNDSSTIKATEIISTLSKLNKRSKSLFEWMDGPLVSAMRDGKFVLLDEMSLAEDAVLERLNSVLEPGRSLVLAEKGGSDGTDGFGNKIIAHEDFRIFATMNPGRI